MIIASIIIGCISGFISAFFGIGGSSIDTPLLKLLGLPAHTALATPLPLTFLTVFFALLVYGKKHLINKRIMSLSLLGGLPGSIAGSFLSPIFSGNFLMLLTALVLFLVGINFLLFQTREKNYPQKKKQLRLSVFYVTSLAFVIGILCGLLANGGGIFFVPVYVMLFGLRMREAIATSLFTIALMALPSTFIHYSFGHIDLATTAAIGLGVAPMAYLGAKMDLKTKSQTIERLFGILLIIFSVYFFIDQLIR